MGTDTNSITIIGRLVRDCDCKYTNTGKPVITFTVAVNESFKKNGEFQEYTNFFEIVNWPHPEYADKRRDQLYKGRQVSITGKLKQQRWNDSEGQTRSKIVIMSQNIQYLAVPQNRENTSTRQEDSHQETYTTEFEDDIPF